MFYKNKVNERRRKCMNIEKYLDAFPQDRELRKKNIETVMKYMNCAGDERLNRWKLFVQDGQGGYTGPAKGYPAPEFIEWGMPGQEGLKMSDAWNSKWFPGGTYSDMRLLLSDDPNYIVVSALGSFKIKFPAYEEKDYQNYFFHVFEMEDGLIKRYHEHMNFCQVYHALGIELPEVEFPHGI